MTRELRTLLVVIEINGPWSLEREESECEKAMIDRLKVEGSRGSGCLKLELGVLVHAYSPSCSGG